MEDIKIIVNKSSDLSIVVGGKFVLIDQHVVEAFTDAITSVTRVHGSNYGQGCFLGFERERTMTRMNIQYYYELNAMRNMKTRGEWACPSCMSYCDGDECRNCGVGISHIKAMVDEIKQEDVNVTFSFK